MRRKTLGSIETFRSEVLVGTTMEISAESWMYGRGLPRSSHKILCRSRIWEPCAEVMRAAEVIKRNGRELQEHRCWGGATDKKEESTKVEKEWGGRRVVLHGVRGHRNQKIRQLGRKRRRPR